MQTVVDSSVLIATINADDSQHERGANEIRKAARPIIVPEYIVAETCAVLVQKASKELADDFMQEMGSNRDFQLLFSTPEFFIASARVFLSTRKKLSFVDCALIELSKEYAVLTFDRVLLKAIKAKRGEK